MSAPIRILIIDDEADYAETMSFWLMAKGYEVRTAHDGVRGISHIAVEPLDIVFLDMRMPGIDGLETLRRIRRVRPELPVIMVTAHCTEERRVEALRAGAQGFFGKADDFSEAARLIRETLRGFASSEGRKKG